MNDDQAFNQELHRAVERMNTAYNRWSDGAELATLTIFEMRVTEVSRLLANRHISPFANTSEQLANHEERLRRIERKVHGLGD